MRIALIADTHGYLDPRIATAVSDAGLLVHAGDVGAGIAAELACLADRVVIVQGNNDPAGSGWPQQVELDLPGGVLAVMHGHQWPARTRHRKLSERFAQARAIVCGHSHRRFIDVQRCPWVLNPGAAGRHVLTVGRAGSRSRPSRARGVVLCTCSTQGRHMCQRAPCRCIDQGKDTGDDR